jgi:GT2 family glycosyltransferase
MVVNSPLIRRSVVDDIGPFDPLLPPVEDWDYWIRCALAGKRFEFCNLEGTLALVRAHAASTSRQSPSVLASWRALRAKIDTLVDDPELLWLNREMKSQLEASVALQEMATGSRARAAWQFLKASILCPRVKGRAKWMLCAVGSAVLSEPQMQVLIKA